MSSESFTITAAPSTDAWRKPPSIDRFNAPIRPHSSPFPLSSFSRTRITFSAAWVETYDQGGVILTMTHPTHRTKWIKCGLEYYENRTFISTVCTDNFSDWSVYPAEVKPHEKITVELIRESKDGGYGVWVYWLKLNEKNEVTERLPLREIAWVFADVQDWNVEIGAYAARPEGKVQGGLDVTFSDFQVDRK